MGLADGMAWERDYGYDTRPTVAPQQCGDKLLMDITILMHNWRCGRYEGSYVLSRLSQMFPNAPSSTTT